MIPDKALDDMRAWAKELLERTLRDHPTDKTMDEPTRLLCQFVQTFLSLDDWFKAGGNFPSSWRADEPHRMSISMDGPNDPLDTPEKLAAAEQRWKERGDRIQVLLDLKRTGEIDHDEYVRRYLAIPRVG